MSSFLYFLPGGGAGTGQAEFEAAGIGYAWPERPIKRETFKGPGGNAAGVTIAAGFDEARVGFFPERQTWVQVPGSPAWCGYYNDELPTPDELARAETIAGYFVKLADGRNWLVPVARAIGEAGWYHVLPRLSTLDADGNWQAGEVVDRYRPLWKLATDWWDTLAAARIEEKPDGDGARVTFDFQQTHDAASAALATNYRIGKIEASLLGLFDDNVVREILNAVVDLPALEEFAKKKMTPDQPPAGSPSEPGTPVGSTTTGQP